MVPPSWRSTRNVWRVTPQGLATSMLQAPFRSGAPEAHWAANAEIAVSRENLRARPYDRTVGVDRPCDGPALLAQHEKCVEGDPPGLGHVDAPGAVQVGGARGPLGGECRDRREQGESQGDLGIRRP